MVVNTEYTNSTNKVVTTINPYKIVRMSKFEGRVGNEIDYIIYIYFDNSHLALHFEDKETQDRSYRLLVNEWDTALRGW
jgi:hypothetical protein